MNYGLGFAKPIDAFTVVVQDPHAVIAVLAWMRRHNELNRWPVSGCNRCVI